MLKYSYEEKLEPVLRVVDKGMSELTHRILIIFLIIVHIFKICPFHLIKNKCII